MGKEEFQRPVFDARIQYYELLRKLLEYGKQVGIKGNLTEWYRSLHETYNMVHAYIEPADAREIKSHLDKARQHIFGLDRRIFPTQNAKLQYRYRIDEELLVIDGAIHKAAKHMFLPLENQHGEFDLNRFLKESDLA